MLFPLELPHSLRIRVANCYLFIKSLFMIIVFYDYLITFSWSFLWSFLWSWITDVNHRCESPAVDREKTENFQALAWTLLHFCTLLYSKFRIRCLFFFCSFFFFFCTKVFALDSFPTKDHRKSPECLGSSSVFPVSLSWNNFFDCKNIRKLTVKICYYNWLYL